MLKKRIITALILLPLFVIFVLEASTRWFAAVTAMFVLWGAWEWTLFAGLVKLSQCLFYLLFILGMMLISLALPLSYVLYASIGFWLLALGLTLIYPKGRESWGKGILLRSLMGVMVLIPCWLAINWIHASHNGPFILLFLMVLIWGADSAAYFVGRAWGVHKLSKQVSPGKTWEGFAGAIVVTMVIALCVLWSFHLPYSEWPWAVALSLVTVIFSVVGDLFESMLKRNAGLKDSGQLLPGHGGILDRIDSLTAAAPVFAVGAFWLGKMIH